MPKASKQQKRAVTQQQQEQQVDPTDLHSGSIAVKLAAIGALSLGAWCAGRAPQLRSSDGRCLFVVRFLFWALFDVAFAPNLTYPFLRIARFVARRLPGSETIPQDEAEAATQELQSHDPSLEWPPADAKLPAEWKQLAARAPRAPNRPAQPYFLNHVRGHVRLRQAARRLGSAASTVLQTAAMAWLLDETSLADASLLRGASLADLGLGALTGASCVCATFTAEVAVGWVKVISFGEVVAPGEGLWTNLSFDVLFHVGVAINEELSLRGWLLLNGVQAAVAGLALSPTAATVLAIAVQSLFFAAAHAGSPGVSRVGLCNLMVGGVAAALNVVLTGNLAFALGWHFCWNLLMGHLLGLSTSGIPMSAKLVSVVPHPAKAALHGGRFGPEQSPLAPAAYGLGIAMLVAFYGTDGVADWESRLVQHARILNDTTVSP